MRLCVSALNATAGVLFLCRRLMIRDGTWRQFALCAPSLLLTGVMFRLAPTDVRWDYWIEGLFVGGTIVAIVSFLYLGRNMAVLPVLRHVTRRGPYGLVRHPAYAGEWLMVLACAMAGDLRLQLPLLVLLTGTLALRIRVEEHVLSFSETYQAYAKTVRWRLIPGLW